MTNFPFLFPFGLFQHELRGDVGVEEVCRQVWILVACVKKCCEGSISDAFTGKDVFRSFFKRVVSDSVVVLFVECQSHYGGLMVLQGKRENTVHTLRGGNIATVKKSVDLMS